MRKRLITFGALVVVLAVAGGVAYATIPDSSGVIHGCYKTNSGALRVIDHPAQTCLPSETAIEWKQSGPQGPTGATGPTAATGATGPAGSALGYAYVFENGSFTNSKGVLSVTHPATGVWCFDLDFTAHVAVATVVGFAGVGNQIVHTSIAPGASDACVSPNPADAAAFVVLPDGVRTDTQFMIEFN